MKSAKSTSSVFQLVSVDGARGFWERMGFRNDMIALALTREHVEAYGGGDVTFMSWRKKSEKSPTSD
jgi:hypothetical protein